MEAVQHLRNLTVSRFRCGHLALSPHAVGEQLMIHILHDTEGRMLAAFSIQRLSIQQNLSRLFFQQPTKAAGKSSLAHAVRSGDRYYLAGADGKGQIPEHRRFLAESAGQPLHR